MQTVSIGTEGSAGLTRRFFVPHYLSYFLLIHIAGIPKTVYNLPKR